MTNEQLAAGEPALVIRAGVNRLARVDALFRPPLRCFKNGNRESNLIILFSNFFSADHYVPSSLA
jgi:hypothetical protein